MCTPGVFPGPSPNTKPIITALKPKPPPPLAPKPRPKSVGGGGDRGSGNNLDIFGEPLFWNDLWVNIWRHTDHTFELGTILCGYFLQYGFFFYIAGIYLMIEHNVYLALCKLFIHFDELASHLKWFVDALTAVRNNYLLCSTLYKCSWCLLLQNAFSPSVLFLFWHYLDI